MSINYTSKMSAAESLAADSNILDTVGNFLISTRYELFLFVAALAAHFLLFGRPVTKSPRKFVKAKSNYEEPDGQAPSRAAPSGEHLGKALDAAFEDGNHREVLRCWSAAKRCAKAPELSLSNAVESMQRFKKETSFIVSEIRGYLRRSSRKGDACEVNDLFESLGSRLDSKLMGEIFDMLRAVDVKPDQRTYEIFINTHFMLRDFAEVHRLAAEALARGLPLTTRATVVVIKASLKASDLDEAVRHFKALKAIWSVSATVSTAPQLIVSQLVEFACKERQLGSFLPALADVPLSEDSVCTMLAECARARDAQLAQQVEALARAQGGRALSESTYCLLIKACSRDPKKVRNLFEELLASPRGMSQEIVLSLLVACNHTGSVSLANRMFEQLKPTQPLVLSAFVRFYTEAEKFDRACDVYEQATSMGEKLLLDGRSERNLMNAALRCGRSGLAQGFLDKAPSDIAKHVAMIRSCASEGNLDGAHAVFESLVQCSTELNSVVYNAVLDACVECRDLRRAEAWMERTKAAGMADVVSYNTLIKAHLLGENLSKARVLMDEMRAAGLQPNRVTFNELVNALVAKKARSGGRSAEVWAVLDEMQAGGLNPNQVTCSILLKCLNAHSSEEDVSRTMRLIGNMDSQMDEVLLSSVVEACVRIGKPELLSSTLRKLTESGTEIKGSHTFGSLIKAYGHARDMDGVWRCWKDMRSRHVRPTSITLGCMVEAVVSNGDTEGAYELIHQMQDDEQCRGVLNSVIYCSVLKGFAREKRLERVWSVYQEMQTHDVDVSVVTYNTILDACVRCGSMEWVDGILADMTEQSCPLNLITYSTIVKGHCQKGDLQTALALVERMRSETKLKPDEIMYNSLLDGCAQAGLQDEGQRLLRQMQKEGVAPSNFTLSIMVKLMSRARKLDAAFALVEEISTTYRFRPNVHVITNLIQACVSNRQLKRGVDTWEAMVADRVQPEPRTYAVLLRACLQQNRLDTVEALLRGALGLEGSSRSAFCGNVDSALVNEALVGLGERGGADTAMGILAEMKRRGSRVRIDAVTQRRLVQASSGIAASPHLPAGPTRRDRRGQS